MDNDENDFVNLNIKKKKTKRNKNILKNTKTCAIYGIFDCTCCKKSDNNVTCNSVINETINQPSTSRISTSEEDENIKEQELNDDLLDDIIDVGIDCIPSTSNISSLEEIENNEENCDRRDSTNENTETNNTQLEHNNMDSTFNETSAEVEDSEMNLYDQSENNTSDETINISTNATITTTSESLSTDETTADTSIKSEVSLFAAEEEEEEIDVVNIPADDTQQNILIDNNQIENAQQELTQQNEIKTEHSDDENQIIDIINFDDTDHRENLVSNLTNMESTSNMGSTASSTNEDEIIDVENLNEENNDPPQQNNADTNSLALRRRTRRLKRRLRSQITINFHKRPRVLRSVMTIDLINTSRDDSIIEINDSPIVPRKVTEVINVDDDDENEEPDLNKTCSPHRIGLGNCPVCLEGLAKKEIMSTICGHVYCARCIKNVIKTTKKCPNCRKNLTLKSIHPLFI